MTDQSINEMMQVMAVPTSSVADDFDLPASRGFVRMEVANLRALLVASFSALRDEWRTELRDGLAGLRTDIREGDAELGAEIRRAEATMRADVHRFDTGVRAEIKGVESGLRAKLREVRSEVHQIDDRLREFDKRLLRQLLDTSVTVERSYRSIPRWLISIQLATVTVVITLINSLRI